MPAGVPGIAGATVANGDRIIWASGLGVWQILRNAGLTLAAADARYYNISNPSGYITGNQTITLSGDVSGSGTTAIAGTLATVNSNVGTFPGLPVNGKGMVTAATNQSYAPLASPAFTGTPSLPTGTTAVTQTAGNNSTALATTAFVQAAVIAADDNTNFVDNSGFSVNQRTYVSGTALASGAFGHDRWKGGASGCTYTFSGSSVATIITITAGSLQQVIEGAALISGSYTLSWTGTAQGRTGAGSYAASPVAVTATAGTNLTVEFNTGTVSRVRLEIGTAASPWQPRPVATEWVACQRFYQTGRYQILFGAYASGAYGSCWVPFPVLMRVSPTVAIAAGYTFQTNAATVGSVGADGARFACTATGIQAAAESDGTWTATADL